MFLLRTIAGNTSRIKIFLILLIQFGLNNIYSDNVHDIHKYNVKIVGSDSKPVCIRYGLSIHEIKKDMSPRSVFHNLT